MYRDLSAEGDSAHSAGGMTTVTSQKGYAATTVSRLLRSRFLPGGCVASDELVAASQPYSRQADTLRDLAIELREAFPSGKLERPVAILSPDRGDGKTYLAANLAITLAAGGPTLLIDGNMRTPRLHAVFGVRPEVGLSELLCGDADEMVIHTMSNLPGMHFIAAGGSRANPIELLHGEQFGLLLEHVSHRFDAVIIDTPADMQAPDARVTASRAGAALVVGREGRSHLGSLQSLTDKLQRARAVIVGLVVNTH
jgi:protein-tyrosine kinase